MRLITLSDYSAEQQDLERAVRQKRYDDALSDWQGRISARRQTIDGHWVDFADAVRQFRLLTAITSFIKWAGVALSGEPARPVLDLPSEQENKWASGQAGEQRVRSRLDGLLGEEWTAVAGYRNRGGEMDLLVVGPSAVVAVEVKYLNGVVHCRGQEWTRDKYDRYGNLVEAALPVRDRKGRAPNRQVNESADVLEAFLGSRGQRVKVRRAVVLAHDASRLGEVKDPGVDFVGALTSGDFDSGLRALLVVEAERSQGDLDVAAIVALVQRDHAHHARRLAGRESRGPEAELAPTVRPALLPERIVAPLSAGNATMSPLALRQLEALVRDIRLLSASEGNDQECRERVRRSVSGHLMSGARWTVLSASQGTLGVGPERELLQQMIVNCRQTFDFEDRTLCAIVAPVAVRLKSEVHAGQGVDEGAADMMSLPCLIMPRVLGATKVAFASQMYAAKALFYSDARKLREVLLQIEAGNPRPESTIKAHSVLASAEPDWQVVYFLGVAAMPPGEDLDIDSDEVQSELMSLRPHFASAFTGVKRVAFNRDVSSDAVSEGFWTLDVGVRKGEDLRRRHALEQALAAFDRSDETMELYFAHAPLEQCVRLLIASRECAKEFRWELLVGESLDGFREGLTRASAIHLPSVGPRRVRELDLYAYEGKARDSGLSWLGKSS